MRQKTRVSWFETERSKPLEADANGTRQFLRSVNLTRDNVCGQPTAQRLPFAETASYIATIFAILIRKTLDA